MHHVQAAQVPLGATSPHHVSAVKVQPTVPKEGYRQRPLCKTYPGRVTDLAPKTKSG